MWKRILGTTGLAVVLLGSGSGCRLFCDGYCDRRERDCERYQDRRSSREYDDPCRTTAPPPIRYGACP